MQTRFTVDGKEIRIDMHEPKTSSPHPAIVLMHGAGGNIGWWTDRLVPQIHSLGIALYAPHYFDRTRTVRADLATITDGVHVQQWLSTLDAALAFAAARHIVDPARVAVLGISLGAFLSLGLAAQLSASPSASTRHRIRALVDLSGGLVPPHAQQATAHFPPTLILHGAMDPIVPAFQAHALDSLLTQLHVKHETHILPGEGHWFSTSAQKQSLLTMAAFLDKHL